MITKGNSASSQGSNVSSLSWNHTVANNANRALIVVVTSRALTTVSSITYHGVALTLLGVKQYNAGNYPRVEIWGLMSPDVGTYPVAVTMSGLEYFSVNSLDFYDPYAPLIIGDIQTASGAAGAATVTVATARAEDYVVDAICSEGTLTIGGGYTQNWQYNVTGSWRGADTMIPGVAGGSVATSWTAGNTWAEVAVVIHSITWTSAVIDRSAADLAALNAKAFVNVTDWTRIYNNTRLVNWLVYQATGVAPAFTPVGTPTTLTIPAGADVNQLAANIEAVRATYGSPATYVFHNWLTGNKNAPDYVALNLWEQTLKSIKDKFIFRWPRTGVAGCGSGMDRNNMFRS